ncbi:hypothetical protein J6590_070619 [Homalodisca vitripennis]|nr:hypothetical protein J6590_070619 [Homalodisca vitripennis]
MTTSAHSKTDGARTKYVRQWMEWCDWVPSVHGAVPNFAILKLRQWMGRCDWVPSVNDTVPNCEKFKCRVKEPAPNKSDGG